jgi:hypothetical protein
MANCPSTVGEYLESTTQLLPLRSTADFFVPAAEFNLPKFSPKQLLGLPFLKEMEDGTMIRAKVTDKLNDLDAQKQKNIKMLLEVGEDGYEEIVT